MSQGKDGNPRNASFIGVHINSDNHQMHSSAATTHLPLQPQAIRPAVSIAQQGGLPAQSSAGVPQAINTSSLLVTQQNPSVPKLSDVKKLQISGHLSNKYIDQSLEQTIDRLKTVVTSSEPSSSVELARKTPLQIKIQGGPVSIEAGRPLQIGNNSNACLQVPATRNNIQVVGQGGQNTKKSSQGTQAQPTTTLSSKSSPHMIYIQTPTGLKPVPTTDIVSPNTLRLPVSSGGTHLMSSLNSKPSNIKHLNIKSSTPQPSLVIQKPKTSSQNFVSVPVSLAPNTSGKHTFAAFVSAIKKPPPVAKSQDNQKVIITPMNVPKMHPKLIFPPSIAPKGSFINFQIANGQLQNDPQGNITVMQDSIATNNSVIPPLQPITAVDSASSHSNSISNIILDSKTSDNSFTTCIPGSRAELIGEQEYALSIPDNNSIGDDVITVSISDENEENQVESYTINIPEKEDVRSGMEVISLSTNVPGILTSSNSSESDHKQIVMNAHEKNANDIENKIEKAKKKLFNKSYSILNKPIQDKDDTSQVQNLYCEEKLEQETETKNSDVQVVQSSAKSEQASILPAIPQINKDRRKSRVSSDVYLQCEPIVIDKDPLIDEDSLGLQWHNDVALLKGSCLQFRTNEFGIIDIIDSDDTTSSLPKYHTPLKQRLARDGIKKPTSPEDLYCCDGCGCHGMAAEFITPNFCSHTCQRNYDKDNPKEKGPVDLKKKRKPRKSLLLKAGTRDQDNGDNISKMIPKEKNSLDCLSTDLTVKMIQPETNDQRNSSKLSKWKHENGFIWCVYLDWCKAEHAPEKFFRVSTAYKHNFKTGMKVEAMDPSHQSLFTVATITEIQGFRLKLHFDGYHENYDFWLNADSCDIFPPGWCEKNGKVLLPPKGYTYSTFSWAQYVKQAKAMLAPRYLFSHVSSANVCPSGFRIGMKLEAEDRKNSLTCVATVADLMGNRMLIHFDSWDDMYDYWVQPTSPYIHPVGWCDKNGYSLTPPNTCKDPENFTWDAYLKETKSVAVPARAFRPRAPHSFKVGMKLEAVDKRVPFLIRVATISDTRFHQIRISFDGLPDGLSFWVDDDSPDIYPVGWCLKTGHPLEPPLTPEEMDIPGPCGTKGCQGLGNALGAKAKTHTIAAECPYRLPPRPVEIPHRLASMLPPPHHSEPRPKEPKRVQRGRPPKSKHLENDHKLETASDDDSSGSATKKRKRAASPMSQETVERSVFEPGYTPNPNWNAPPTWGLASHCMPLDDILQRLSLRTDPRNWSQTDVQEFVEKIAKSREVSWRFCKQRIDGESFLMLAQEDLVSILGMRLGPAIKIYNSIIQLRKKIVV